MSRTGILVGIVALVALFWLLTGGNRTLTDELTSDKPFLQAAFAGDVATMKLLLDKGEDVNQKDAAGNTALHYVIRLDASQHHPQGRHQECLRLLLERGANLTAKNTSGETALYRAVWNSDMTAALLGKGAPVEEGMGPRTPLISAAYVGGPLCAEGMRSMRLLVEKGADINAAESPGMTALWTAALYGCPEMVRFLLDQGVRTDTKNARGETLMQSLEHGLKIHGENAFDKSQQQLREQSVALIRQRMGQ